MCWPVRRRRGWTAFTIGEQPYEASVKGAAGHTFADGSPFNMRHAMSLGKLYWSTPTKSGTHPEWYQAFEKAYVAPVAAGTPSPSPAKAAPVAEAAMTLPKKKVVAK